MKRENTEERINKFTRMCLEWQSDIHNNIKRTNNWYFTKYHVGKFKKEYINDINNAIIDRPWVINKMNLISKERQNEKHPTTRNKGRIIGAPSLSSNEMIHELIQRGYTVFKNNN